MAIALSDHARNMLVERKIHEDWLWLTINNPDQQERGTDNNTHYYKKIHEYENRVLHVVINHSVSPNRIVTVFFDRRAGRKT